MKTRKNAMAIRMCPEMACQRPRPCADRGRPPTLVPEHADNFLYYGGHDHDPYRCLRCSSIAIGIWNILFCLIQFGLLGWQVQVVKQWQWYWENRELPATGAIDQFQARFPGLYQIYTETPERRRVNAMFAIVLICLGLTIVHLPVSAAMLFGCVKRLPNWVLPWFFTSVPLALLSTTYSVLWWSGDIFNEQLTFSVLEFVLALAVNGICIVVVFLYYQRLRGKLVSEQTGEKPKEVGFIAPITRSPWRKLHNGGDSRLAPTSNQSLPPWVESLPEKPPPGIERKLRRKERREWEMRRRLERERQQQERKLRGKSISARQTRANWAEPALRRQS